MHGMSWRERDAKHMHVRGRMHRAWHGARGTPLHGTPRSVTVRNGTVCGMVRHGMVRGGTARHVTSSNGRWPAMRTKSTTPMDQMSAALPS
jgi:hypothetical protein